jgi:hypothetical protein
MALRARLELPHSLKAGKTLTDGFVSRQNLKGEAVQQSHNAKKNRKALCHVIKPTSK